MLEVFRDPVWQFIGAAVTFLFGLAAATEAFLIYRLQRTRKSISLETRRVPLFNPSETAKGKLEVLFDGKSVHDADIIQIRVINSGNVPIIPADFVDPITFVFGKKERVLRAEVAGTSPQDLKGTVTSDSKAVVLSPVLLNSEDYLTVKLLATPSGAQPEVHGRIVGATISEFRDQPPVLMQAVATIMAVSLVFGMILALVLQSVYLGVFLAGFALAGVYGYVLQRTRVQSLRWRRIR